MNIILSTEIIRNKSIENEGLMAYIGLKILHNIKLKKYLLQPRDLTYYLTNKIQSDKNFFAAITKGFKILSEENLITILGQDKCGKKFEVDISNLYLDIDNSPFTQINQNEVCKILNSDFRFRYSLLRYFTILVSTFDICYDDSVTRNKMSYFASNYGLEFLSKLSGFNVNSIIKYNNALEELGLIYVYNDKNFIMTKSGQVRYPTNFYTRYENKSVLLRYLGKSEKDLVNTDNDLFKISNVKRKLTQRYYQLYKKNNYTKPEVQEIYEFILSENERMRKLYEEKGNKKYLDKIKDVEIFNKYQII